jgi:hypothetical protein
MNFAPCTLVVSRTVDTERRARFMTEALRIDLRYWGFFDAIDGPRMQLRTDAPTTIGRHKRPAPEPLSPGEIGCLLSHVAIWRMGHTLGLPSLCVIEDDVELPAPESFWTEWAVFVSSLPSDWGAIHAGSGDVLPPTPINEHAARVAQAYGTHFMVLKPWALRLLAELPVDMSQPVDWMLRPLFDTGHVYCPRANIIRHRDDAGGMPQ